MAEELLEKISAEKCWALTAKILQNLVFLRGSRIMVPLFSKGEDIFAPIWGWEKFREINTKIWVDMHKKLMHWVKETYNLQVDNAIGAANFAII